MPDRSLLQLKEGEGELCEAELRLLLLDLTALKWSFFSAALRSHCNQPIMDRRYSIKRSVFCESELCEVNEAAIIVNFQHGPSNNGTNRFASKRAFDWLSYRIVFCSKFDSNGEFWLCRIFKLPSAF